MIVSNIETVTFIVILLFLLPIIWKARSRSLFKSFNFINFVKTLNHSLILQGLLIPIIACLFWILDFSKSNIAGLFAGLTYTYIVVGLFMYLPGLLFLNLIKLIVEKKTEKGTNYR